MLRWPWVSRGRLDDALDQIVWLRREIEELRDGQTRLERVKAGMSEEPRPPKREILPMPKDLMEYIAGMSSPSLRKNARDIAYRRNASGEAWGVIEASVLQPPEDRELAMSGDRGADNEEEQDETEQ